MRNQRRIAPSLDRRLAFRRALFSIGVSNGFDAETLHAFVDFGLDSAGERTGDSKPDSGTGRCGSPALPSPPGRSADLRWQCAWGALG